MADIEYDWEYWNRQQSWWMKHYGTVASGDTRDSAQMRIIVTYVDADGDELATTIRKDTL